MASSSTPGGGSGGGASGSSSSSSHGGEAFDFDRFHALHFPGAMRELLAPMTAPGPYVWHREAFNYF